MYIRMMTWLSIAALLSSIAFWSSTPDFQMALNLAVCIAAAVVLVQPFISSFSPRWRPLLSRPYTTGRSLGSQSL